MDLQLTRSTYNVVQMTELASELGLPLARSLEGSGIDPAQMEQLDAEIYVHQELTVIANIVRHLDHVPGLGLRMGQRFHMSVYGVLSFAMCSCPTVGDALRLGLRYGPLTFTLIDKRLDVVGDELRVSLDDRHIPPPLRRFVLERDLAGLFNVTREMFSTSFPKSSVSLAYPAPAYAGSYAGYFDIAPEFGAARNLAIYDAALMSQPMPQANAPTLRFCEAQLQQIVARKQPRAGVSGKIRDFLLRRPGTAPDMEAAAAELHTTSRNLRRQLDAEGTSFRALVDEVRQALAEELLAVAQLNVEEVADRLGYNEVSSFTNAFKRWTGMPPRDWRNQHLQRPRPSVEASSG